MMKMMRIKKNTINNITTTENTNETLTIAES